MPENNQEVNITRAQINSMHNILYIQGNDPISDTDDYMRGMFNGMELMVSVVEKREPKYKDKPKNNQETGDRECKTK
jgi:hypothetical protein